MTIEHTDDSASNMVVSFRGERQGSECVRGEGDREEGERRVREVVEETST